MPLFHNVESTIKLRVHQSSLRHWFCFTPLLSNSFLFFSFFKQTIYFSLISQSSFFLSGCCLSLTLWYYCGDLLINVLACPVAVPTEQQIFGAMWHLPPTLQDPLFGKVFILSTFLLSSSNFQFFLSFSLSLSLSLTLHCLLPPLFCLPLDKWTLCLLVKWTWKQ